MFCLVACPSGTRARRSPETYHWRWCVCVCASQVGLVRSFTVKSGNWYVRIVGDYYQMLEGSVLEANATGALEPVLTEPQWNTCASPVTRDSLLEQNNGRAAGAPVVGNRRALLQDGGLQVVPHVPSPSPLALTYISPM